jgi:NAD(P)-dependent dehydrogenase (short-subunit alcohol dehydrogenase family)
LLLLLVQAEVFLSPSSPLGLGKGIAIELARAGCIVYVTGRTVQTGQHPLPGTITETADIINKSGGIAIPVVCDVSKDDQLQSLFER